MTGHSNPYEPPRVVVADPPNAAPQRRPLAVTIALFILGLLILRAFHALTQIVPLVAEGAVSVVGTGMHAVSLAVTVVLAVFIGGGRNWARIVYLVCVILAVLQQAGMFVAVFMRAPESFGRELGWAWVASMVAPYLAMLVVVALLFGPGRGWFAPRS